MTIYTDINTYLINFHYFISFISYFINISPPKWIQATGISVSDESISEFNEFKLQKMKLKYVIYKIEKGKIVTESRSDDADFGNFVSQLPANDCRYALYDMAFTTNDGRPGSKLVMISW